MRDSVSLVITVILLVMILLLFPLYNYFDRQDDMTYNIALKAITGFVDEVVQDGYLTQEMYDTFLGRLSNTGYSYDVELEIHRKMLTKDPYSDKYIEQYLIEYNKDLFQENTGEVINRTTYDEEVLKNEAIYLNKGDQIYVRVNNSNRTMSASLLSLLTSKTPNERIQISYGGTIKNITWANSTISDLYQEDIVVTMELEDPNEADVNNAYPLYTFSNEDDRIIRYQVKLINVDDTSIPTKLAENLRLVGDDPNNYISPSSVTSIGSDTYRIEFRLEEERISEYLGENPYNRFYLFLPSNILQGIFSKNKSQKSDYFLLRDNETTEVPEIN